MDRDVDDPDLPLAELFRACPAAARVFFRHRTGCVGCPIAPFHTVVDTCAEYGLDEAAFRDELRAAVREGTVFRSNDAGLSPSSPTDGR